MFLLLGKIYIVFALIFFKPSSISETEGFFVCPPIKVALAPSFKNKSAIFLLSTTAYIATLFSIFFSLNNNFGSSGTFSFTIPLISTLLSSSSLTKTWLC